VDTQAIEYAILSQEEDKMVELAENLLRPKLPQKDGHNHDWLKLSMDLGYHDQSHFIKDFKSVIGQTPDEYVRQSP
jgi:AraC-like DNA-binding protein